MICKKKKKKKIKKKIRRTVSPIPKPKRYKKIPIFFGEF